MDHEQTREELLEKHGNSGGHADEASAWDYLFSGGGRLVRGHKGEGGIRAHRGVLHPDEYVDAARARKMVEAELGFTYDDIKAVYRQGKKSDVQLELRERIDGRLLELANAGGNMVALGRLLGWRIEPGRKGAGGESCRTMERALARARLRANVARLNSLLEELARRGLTLGDL